MKVGERFALRFNGHISNRWPVLALVQSSARASGLSEQAASELELAVDEVLSNVAEHAYPPPEDGPVELVCERVPEGLKVTVRDEGLPFDPDRLPHDPLPLSEGAVHLGLGLNLARHSVDAFEFHFLGPQGKAIVLVKTTPERPEEKVETPPPPRRRTSPETMVRVLQPADALDIIRLSYRVYGYHYTYTDIYYPDRLEGLLSSGALHSVGAFTQDGTLVGHGTLHPDEAESRQGEIAMVFVDPNLRLPGCTQAILSELYAEIARRQWVGTYGDMVTPHVQSQKLGVELNMRDSALLVGQVLGDQHYRNLHANSAQRVSLLHMYQSLTPRNSAPWYMPERHRAMLEAIAQHLELPVEACAGAPKDSDPGILVARTNLSIKNAIIQVFRTGPESLGRILHLNREFHRQGLEQVQIRLSLGDTGTPALTEHLEAHGFFFAGVCPSPLQGDWLVLLNLFGAIMDYGAIKVLTEFGNRLKDYVRQCDPGQDV